MWSFTAATGGYHTWLAVSDPECAAICRRNCRSWPGPALSVLGWEGNPDIASARVWSSGQGQDEKWTYL